MRQVRLRLTIALVVTLLMHLTLLSRVRIDGVRPDALLLIAITAGLIAGPERGAVIGFAAGVLADLFVQAPFGLSALAYCLIGFAVGTIQSGILRATWWIPVLTALAASTCGVVLYSVLGAVIGQPDLVSPRMMVIAALVGVMNAALAPAASRLMSWSLKTAGPL